MPAVPTVTQLDLAFPVAAHLPEWPEFDSLPAEFQRGTHPACHAVEALFYRGGEGFSRYTLRARYEMTQEEGKAVLRLVRAHLGCWDYKQEHKIAGCGALLDRWFEVSR